MNTEVIIAMDEKTKKSFSELESDNKTKRYEAYMNILDITKNKIDWAYAVWDQLIDDLTNSDAHKRSRAAQFLSHLAISDPENRILYDFPAVWKVTKDEKFVTARHSLQAIWRVGLAGSKQKNLVVDHLVERYKNCLHEKNYTLIRFDIIQGLKNLYQETNDESIKEKAIQLIDLEKDQKYQKKYASVWK